MPEDLQLNRLGASDEIMTTEGDQEEQYRSQMMGEESQDVFRRLNEPKKHRKNPSVSPRPDIANPMRTTSKDYGPQWVMAFDKHDAHKS